LTKKVLVYRWDKNAALLDQLSVKREWMDNTPEKHAYRCMPISLANTLGWGISFPVDISFIWDGIDDSSDSHVKILKGEKYCTTQRGNATISFNTYLTIQTDDEITTLITPVPNYFNKNAQCYTSLISTSFYKSMMPVAWKITEPNIEITIPAGMPVATLIPISLKGIEDIEMNILNEAPPENFKKEIDDNLKFFYEKRDSEGFGNLYRKAENAKGEKVGKHEVQKINLRTKSW
jgi:hypothetical protein